MRKGLSELIEGAPVTLLGEDASLPHAVTCVALTPDGDAAWCIGHDCATLVSTRDFSVLHRVTLTLTRPSQALATGPRPEDAVVIDNGQSAVTLTGERLADFVISVGASSLSRDGTVLATVPHSESPAQMVSVWRMRPLRLIRRFAGEAPVEVSDDGALVAHGIVGWKGLGVGFTRVSDGVTVKRSLPKPVSHLRLDAQRAAVCVVGGDALARVPMDPAERIESAPLDTPTRMLAATPSGVVRVSRVGARLVITRDGARAAELAVGGPFFGAVSASGETLFGVDTRVPFRVDLETGFVERGSSGHDVVRDLAWSPDGALVTTVARDGTCRVWGADEGDERARYEGFAAGEGVAVAWSRDGRALFVREGDGTLTEWSLESGEARRRWAMELPPAPVNESAPWRRPVAKVRVSPDGSRAAVIDQGVALVDLEAGSAGAHTPERRDAAWLDDDPATLVTLSSQRASTGTLWRVDDLRTRTRLAEGRLQTYSVPCLAQDGRSVAYTRLAVSGAVVRHRLDRAGLHEPATLPFGAREVLACAGERLIAVSTQLAPRPTLVRWADGELRELATLAPHTRPERAWLSPNGARLALLVHGRVAVLSLTE
ncbi:MAG: LpqB family beta-propeller domain-containing protein [Polyangiales bacterium]